MKEYNVLEASGLCMNGNPIDDCDEFWLYEITCGIELCLRLLRKSWPAFEKGGYESKLIGEDPEPIIMPNRVLMTTKDNSIMGVPVYTRYNQLPWWKKAMCFFSRNYKSKFIDMKGFEMTFENKS